MSGQIKAHWGPEESREQAAHGGALTKLTKNMDAFGSEGVVPSALMPDFQTGAQTSSSPDDFTIPAWRNEAPRKNVDILNDGVEIDGVRYLTPDQLDELTLDSKILYLFLLVQQKDNQIIGKKIDEISGITDQIEASNQIFNDAATAQKEAGKDGKVEAPASVIAFSEQHGLGLEAGKKYNREDWDINLELIDKQQNKWIFDSEVVTYDLEQQMSQAATNMQLATKMMGTLQSMREKTISAYSFR